MCGIAGIVNLDGPQPISLELLQRMTGVLRHRGPDETGIYLDDWTGLSHARLSIIDLSSGTQPIHNEDKSLWIVYNGEIFNYHELKEDLLKKGHRFYTTTDTEVLLHLYEEKGPSCLDDLNGQFAFAIWDTEEKSLFIARDRVGILPLHYTIHNGRLIFASEIKAIFTVQNIPRRVDPIALDQIFTFWTSLNGRTFFDGIHELPAGHYLETKGKKITIRKYWGLPFYGPEGQWNCPIEKITEELQSLLLDSISIRLRADVPVAAYLSGGLDSSGVSALVKNHFNRSLSTFGIQFEEKAYDETDYQNHMVSALNTKHTALLTTNRHIGAAFPAMIWHCEKPLLRTAPVPLYLLSNAVNEQGFKVVLTGEGADEVFGGYNIFRETKVRQFWARQPNSNLRPLLIKKLYPYIFEDNQRIKHFTRSFFRRGLEKTQDPFFSHLIRWENTRKIRKFLSADVKESIGNYNGYEEIGENLPEAFGKWDAISKAQYLEMTIFLSNYLLSSQGDRVAMAHSVEIRVPYLDHRIIEFMGRVPSKWKIRVLDEKYILKRLYRGTLPDRIVDRPKHPYRAPIHGSFLKGKPFNYVEDYLSENRLKDVGLFDAQKVRRLFNKLKTANHSSELDDMAFAGILSSQIIYDQFDANFPAKAIEPISPDLLVDRRSNPGIRDQRSGIRQN